MTSTQLDEGLLSHDEALTTKPRFSELPIPARYVAGVFAVRYSHGGGDAEASGGNRRRRTLTFAKSSASPRTCATATRESGWACRISGDASLDKLREIVEQSQLVPLYTMCLPRESQISLAVDAEN